MVIYPESILQWTLFHLFTYMFNFFIFIFLQNTTIFGVWVLMCLSVMCVCVSTCDSSYRIPSFLLRLSTAVCACALAGNADMLYERCFYKLQSVLVSPYTNFNTKGPFTLSESNHKSKLKVFNVLFISVVAKIKEYFR